MHRIAECGKTLKERRVRQFWELEQKKLCGTQDANGEKERRGELVKTVFRLKSITLTNTPIIMQKMLNKKTIDENRKRNLEGSFKLISSGTTRPTPSNMYKLFPKNTDETK